MSQAHALGLVPRILVLHTNPDERGQAGRDICRLFDLSHFGT